MKNYLILLLVSGLTSCALLPVYEIKINDKIRIIDVRTPEEFNTGHLEGAINIPYDHIGKKIQTYIKDKNTPIYVYCRSGNRSWFARRTLKKMGYKHVINAGAISRIKLVKQETQ